jgi:hypothetical protein
MDLLFTRIAARTAHAAAAAAAGGDGSTNSIAAMAGLSPPSFATSPAPLFPPFLAAGGPGDDAGDLLSSRAVGSGQFVSMRELRAVESSQPTAREGAQATRTVEDDDDPSLALRFDINGLIDFD